MPRAMWKGAVSFGLVNIPVSLTPAAAPKNVQFHMFHDADGGRIREKRVCEIDGKEVEYAHIVKGYEPVKGQVVTLTKEELKAIDPVADRTISIESFVKFDEVDPLLFDSTYYVMPEGRSDKAYGLLATVMNTTERVAIGRIVLSTKQHLCMLRLVKGVLRLTTMLYPDEVVAAPAAVKPSATAKEAELAAALVKQLEGPFTPKAFVDDYRERVLKLIEQKGKGHPIQAAEEPHEPAVTSLSDALERSLSRSKTTEKTTAKKAAVTRAHHPRRARTRKSA